MESEANNNLPFMDVSVTRSENSIVRSVYRKPTFTGLYTRWDSFCDTKQKIGLVRSLTWRAMKICSESTLDVELNKLRGIFEQNGFPINVINTTFKKVAMSFHAHKENNDNQADSTRKKDPVVLRLPWLGRCSTDFKRDITHTVEKAYPSARMRVIFTSNAAFPGTVKDVLPVTMNSSIIYHYTCSCGLTYIGKTTQHLSQRIKQHIPDKLLTPTPVLRNDRNDSAILKHLKARPECIAEIRANVASHFKILARGRNRCHLDVLEALHIKTQSPPMCLQKDFVRQLHLF